MNSQTNKNAKSGLWCRRLVHVAQFVQSLQVARVNGRVGGVCVIRHIVFLARGLHNLRDGRIVHVTHAWKQVVLDLVVETTLQT
jgi:hypothetical protein